MRISLGLSLALGTWVLGLLGAFAAIDGVVYDAFLRLRAKMRQSPSQVLLMEIDDRSDVDEEDYLISLISLLNEQHPKQIVFTFLPSENFPAFFKMAQESGNVVFGRTATVDPLDPEELVLSSIPDSLERYRLTERVGVVRPPAATAGTYRSQSSHVQIGTEDYPSLEVLAAEKILGEEFVFPGNSYLIDFQGGMGSLPNITVSRSLEGDLIPELVDGRCVLVGLKPPLSTPGLYTPTTAGAQRMSLLEYQGQALNTLLSGRVIASLGPFFRLVMLMGLALVLSMLYQFLSIQISSWVSAAILFGYCGVTVVAFIYFRTWLPLTELAFCQGSLYVLTVRRRALQITKATRELIADSSGQLKDKYWPTHFHSSSPSWSLIAHMINQTLDLNKLIFLEAEPNKSHLREILALHCSFEDIIEKRRDYGRSPYTDAIATRAPLRVKDFMTLSSEDEQQYLSPLIFCGELLGFWAIGIDKAKVASIPRFKSLLGDYTRRVSELLYHARRVEESGSHEISVTKRLAGATFESTFQSLQTTLGLLQYRLSTLEVLLNRLDTGVIVYDIFGRVLQINDVMLALLKKENLAPFEMSALDLILSLSDFDISKSRKILRRIIVENSSISFPVTLQSTPSNRSLLHLKPLVSSVTEESGGMVDRVGAKSILCEIVDTTSMTKLSEMKAQLTSRLSLQIRDDLAAIEMASSILAIDQDSIPRCKSIADIIHDKVQKTVHTLTECRHYLDLTADVDDMERFPVDPRPPLMEALDRSRRLAAQRGLSIEIREPAFVSYVLASPDKLRQMLLSILNLLCQDAADNSTLLVRITEDVDVVAFDFSNMGFGIPNELLHEYLFGDQSLASTDLQNMQSAVRWVEAWGGHFEGVSGVGVGMHFTVHLAKFI